MPRSCPPQRYVRCGKCAERGKTHTERGSQGEGSVSPETTTLMAGLGCLCLYDAVGHDQPGLPERRCRSSFDLRPVIATLAGDYKLASIEVSQQGASDWVLVSPDPEMLRINGLLTFGQRVEVNRSIKEWTDDYSNLLELLN